MLLNLSFGIGQFWVIQGERDLFGTFVNGKSIVGNGSLFLCVKCTKIILFATNMIRAMYLFLLLVTPTYIKPVFRLGLHVPRFRFFEIGASAIHVFKDRRSLGMVSSNQVLPQAVLAE
jgi:hypothetical protein